MSIGLKGKTLVLVNGELTTWRAFTESNEFDLCELCDMESDLLFSDDKTYYGGFDDGASFVVTLT